ncbi:MAG TPA: FmdB family zinc ribbon protein [Ktedonobacterales bacterium]
MPTYDYVCETCGNRFEEWQKITDEPTKICPACGGPVHRVIYPVGLVFKGSGFYKTDNRAAPPAAESSTASAAKDKETGGGDGKAAAKDSKSEATKTSAGGEAAAPASAASKSE